MLRNKPVHEDRTRALLELLYHVSREVATALDLRTVLQRVLFEAMRNVGGERASIVVMDEGGKPLDATIVYGHEFHEHTTQQLRDTVERGLAGWVVRERKPALVLDTSRDERWLRRADDSSDKTGAKSAICVPLLAREKLVGVLTLVHSIPNAFTDDDFELMQAIADQAGVAVLNARLYTESQRQARVMTALAESAASINTSLRLEEVLQRILNQTIQALQVETATIALMDAQTGELVFRAATGQNAGNIIGLRVPAGEGLTGAIVRDGRALAVAVRDDDKSFPDLNRLGGIRPRAVAAAPIQTQAGLIGILEAINPVSGAFDADALLVMTGLGSLAGTTIQNAELYEQLNLAHTRYRELFEDNIDPILITDWQGQILEANRQALLLSAYDNDELRALNIDQLHTVNWKSAESGFESLRNGEPYSYESLLHKQDGASVPVEVHVRRVEFQASDSLQWMLRNISERKALDALREDLTAMIYHDLRSPLSNIISGMEVLDDLLDPKDESARAIVRITNNSTTRIQRLVSSLLDLNSLESGQPIGEQSVTDARATIHQSLRDVAQSITSRRQQVETILPENLPPIWVDVDMIRRVLTNLIENAAKYTPGNGHIQIGAQVDGEWLELWVKDDGPGIPAAEHELIFNKFTRLRGRDKSTGLGVGLALCRLAVQGHGGRIWVESREGEGSTFRFTLPLATAQQIVSKAK